METLTIDLDRYPGEKIPALRPMVVAEIVRRMCDALIEGHGMMATGEAVNIAAALAWRIGFDCGRWMQDDGGKDDRLAQAAAFIAWAFRQGAGLKDQ